TLDGNDDGIAAPDMGAYEFDPAAPAPEACLYIFCPRDIQADAIHGSIVSVVDYPAPQVSPGADVSCSPPSGAEFPGGASTVTCAASLPTGESKSCSFRVTVTVRPPNDDTEYATRILTLPYTDRLDTLNATMGVTEASCSGPTGSVWYVF